MAITRRRFLRAGAGLLAGACAGQGIAPAMGRENSSTKGTPMDGVVMDASTMAGREGFFRVGKSTQGRWWLVRPDGTPMLYRGVCALWMPDNYQGSEAVQFRRNWERENGKDIEKFTAHCFGLLRDCGFNALGEWATPQFWDRGWPFTVLIHVRQVRKESNITPKLIDVFDPAWQKAYEARSRSVCTPLAASKDLVGYFVDNEGGWYTARRDFVWGQDQGPMVDRNVLGQQALLLQVFLAADPKHPGHQAAWDWVLARHGGSVAQVAADWGADFDSPGTLRERTAKNLVLASRGYRQDHEAFAAHYTREYFRLTAEAIRKYDPNHLLLGPRFGGTPGDEVLKAIAPRHVDVVSWNCYNLGFRKRCDEIARATGLAQLNGEYSWASGGFLDWKKLQARGTFSEKEKEVCLGRGQATLEQAFTHPALVGYTWYKFCWNPTAPDQPGYGLTDSAGRRSPFNTPVLRTVNGRLEGIARGEIEPASLPA
jgi:hypothetical protein